MSKEDWEGCNEHETWDDDCIHCSMNKDVSGSYDEPHVCSSRSQNDYEVYYNYEMYQAMADT